MVNMLRCACRIAVFAIFAGQYSCIDKQYDLSNLDTDDVTIGNELTLPLGTGIIAAGDIVHIEDNEEITVDDAGNYVARYSGEIGVDMPGEIGIGYRRDRHQGELFQLRYRRDHAGKAGDRQGRRL